MTLPQAEITRIEAEANSKWPLDENIPPTKYTSSRNALMLDFRSAYVFGAQAEAVRGREMAAGLLEWADENDFRQISTGVWGNLNGTSRTTAELLNLFILDTQKQKG